MLSQHSAYQKMFESTMILYHDLCIVIISYHEASGDPHAYNVRKKKPFVFLGVLPEVEATKARG